MDVLPHSDAHEALPRSAERQWTRYVAEWTAWNHARATAALAAAAALILAHIVS